MSGRGHENAARTAPGSRKTPFDGNGPGAGSPTVRRALWADRGGYAPPGGACRFLYYPPRELKRIPAFSCGAAGESSVSLRSVVQKFKDRPRASWQGIHRKRTR